MHKNAGIHFLIIKNFRTAAAEHWPEQRSLKCPEYKDHIPIKQALGLPRCPFREDLLPRLWGASRIASAAGSCPAQDHAASWGGPYPTVAGIKRTGHFGPKWDNLDAPFPHLLKGLLRLWSASQLPCLLYFVLPSLSGPQVLFPMVLSVP